jgi:hypothetical protein
MLRLQAERRKELGKSSPPELENSKPWTPKPVLEWINLWIVRCRATD